MTFEKLSLWVMDADKHLFGDAVDDWDVATLIACMSEDPADWSDVRQVWQRYRSSNTCELVDAIPIREMDCEMVAQCLDVSKPWAAVDLVHKRIFSGGGYDEFSVSHTFGGTGDGDNDDTRVSIKLPLWWKIHNLASISDTLHARDPLPRFPCGERAILWGKPWLEYLAKAMLFAARETGWRKAFKSASAPGLHRFTIEVHKHWLMTPRADLDGRIPRECLLAGREWLESLIDSRRMSTTKSLEFVPVPSSTRTYQDGPMGTIEISMYFDCTRELIQGGWKWLAERDELDEDDGLQEALVEHFEILKCDWLDAPFEGGGKPADDIASERERIPLIAGPDAHILDCDCPICLAMAGASMGPCYLFHDAHHLELDDEFAFSMCETYDEWEFQTGRGDDADSVTSVSFSMTGIGDPPGVAAYGDNEEDDDEMVRSDRSHSIYNQWKKRRKRKNARAKTSSAGGEGAWKSVWENSYVDWEAVEGTPMADMAISFLVADMVSSLKQQPQQGGHSQQGVDSLNQALMAYRSDFVVDRRQATDTFKQALDVVASRHRMLAPRSADLQSKLDELCRR
jgi:hypothetical protein